MLVDHVISCDRPRIITVSSVQSLMLSIWTTLNISDPLLTLEEVFIIVAMVIIAIMMLYEGFDWSLHFKWDALTADLKAKRLSPIEPIK